MPRGRPSKYQEEYPDWLITHMGKGLSFESFAGEVGVNIDTLYEWAKTHDEFSEAKKIGYALSLQFWEKLGMSGIGGKIKGFSAVTWIFVMKCRFRAQGYNENMLPVDDKNKKSGKVKYKTEWGSKKEK